MTAATKSPTVLLSPPQAEFLDSNLPFVGFVGGVGSGKSFVLCYDVLRRCRRGGLYMVAAPTFPMLRDATIRSFMDVAQRVGAAVRFHKSETSALLPGCGAEVLFRSADDPERMRGPNLSGVSLDEASLMHRDVFDVCIGRLRQGGRFGHLRAAFTPKGRRHWTYEVFGTGKSDTGLVHARTADNPFLAEEFEVKIRGQYTSILAAQELGGEFVEFGGQLVQRAWFRLAPELPAAPTARIRYWDTAATEDGGAYTAGVLMCLYADRRFGVEDVARGQWSAGRRDQVMRDTAELDRLRHGHVTIWREQEPGGSGKEASEAAARNLSGFDVHADRVTGDKVTRYQPFAAQVEAGNVLVKVAHWTEDYLDEQCAFPEGPYADQADASSGAFNKLAGGADWSQGIGVPDAQSARESRPGVFRTGGRGGVFRS